MNRGSTRGIDRGGSAGQTKSREKILVRNSGIQLSGHEISVTCLKNLTFLKKIVCTIYQIFLYVLHNTAIKININKILLIIC